MAVDKFTVERKMLNSKIINLLWVSLYLVIFSSCGKQVSDFVSGAKVEDLPGSGASTAPIAQPTIQWTASSQSTNKSAAATLNLTLQLSGASTKTIIVPLNISGTAILNSDYSAPALTSISIPAGQTSTTLSVTIINDGSAGSNKNVLLTLGTPTNAMLGSTSLHTITIINDIAVNLSVAASSVVTEGTNAVFAVTLSSVCASTVTVHYTTSNGTATAGTNYTLTSGTLTFNPGVTSQNITVPTTDAGAYFSPGKTFSVTLSSAFNAGLGTSVGVGTINSNHSIPSVQWTVATQSTNKSAAATLTVTAQLSNVSAQAVTLPFSLGGTAVLNTDYSISPASPLTIAAGSTTASTSVTIINNSVAGANTTITLTEGTPTNATVGATSVQTITITNDLLGNFSITGITGSSDAVLDAFLNGGVNATINWGAATGATSYDVTVYQNDGTTVQCALANTVSTSYAFSSCTLTAGQTYKAKVTAKGSGPSQPATNNFYSFFVNSPPIAATIATRFVMMGSTVSTDVISGASCAFAGCTLSIASSANGGIGTTSLSGNNIVYTPSQTGTDTFSYVISDGRGAIASGTINVKVVTAFTWTGGGANASWATTNNWCGSLNAGKSACLGGAQPGAADAAVFDGTCSSNCSANINSNVNIGSLSLNSGYVGTVTQNAGFTITLNNTAGFSQAAGTFVGGNSAISSNGNFSLTNGTFTSTSATLTIGGNITVSGASTVFTHHSGLIVFKGTNLGVGTLSVNNFYFSGYGTTVTMVGTIDIAGTLTFDDTGYMGGYMSGGTMLAHGAVNIVNHGYRGTSLVKLVGSSSQTITGNNNFMPGLEVASTGGTVTYSGSFSVFGDYTYTSGTIDASTATLTFSGSSITPGSFTYNNIGFSSYGGNFSLNGTLKVGGSLTLSDTAYGGGFINGGTIVVSGDVSALASGFQGSTLLKITGSSSQTITAGSGTRLPNIEIASTGGTVAYSGTLTFFGNYTYTSGTVDASTSTLVFYAGTIIPGAIAYNNVTFAGYGDTHTISGTLNVNGTLSMTDTAYYGGTINGGTILAKGDVSFTNHGASGTTGLSFAGSAASTLTISPGSALLRGAITVNKTGGGSLTLASDASFNSVGQTFSVTSGSVNMAGYNLTLKTLSLSAGTSISRNAGVLNVNGSSIGAGAYSGGTISN